MEMNENLYDLIKDLQEKIENLEEKCLDFQYEIRQLQNLIEAVDARIDILKGENDV